MDEQHESTGGVSSIFVSGHLCVYGGPVPDKVWLLDLNDCTWDEVQCRGDIPAARHHHAVCSYKDRMLVHGGSLLEGGREEHPLYSLDVDTGVWTHVLTSGDAPMTRSHHTTVVIDDMLIVYGGRSAVSENPTTLELDEHKRQGFFDVHVLNLQQLKWYRIERYDPQAPMLWGHSATVFRHFVLVYGGFDVSESTAGTFHDVPATPVATLSEVVYIYDTQRCEWKKATPHQGQDYPVPRALHGAHVLGGQMLIYGGITVDRNGRPTNVLDAWLWDVSSGNWSPFVLTLNYWSGKKPLAAALSGDNTIVMASNQTEAHFYSLQSGRWQTQPCDPSRLYKPKTPPPAMPMYVPRHIQVPPVREQLPTNPPSIVSEPPPPAPAPADPAPMQEPPSEPPVPTQEMLPPARIPDYHLPQPLVPAPPMQPVDPYAENKMRHHQQLVDQEQQRREEQVQALRDRIGYMQEQLVAYQGFKHEMVQPRHLPDNPEISPQRNAAFAIPATLDDVEAQDHAAQHIAQLADSLRVIQDSSQHSLHEAYARHREQLTQARNLHAERIELIKKQQQEHQDAQLELANLETKQDTAELLRKQLSLLQEQQKQLAGLQNVTPLVPPDPPAVVNGVPDQIRSMAAALDKLSSSSTLRGPSVTNVYPTTMHDVAGIQHAIKNMNTAYRDPVSQDNRVPRVSPPRDTSRSPAATIPNHLQRIKSQIETINRTTREESLRGFSKRVSPPRLRHASVM